MKRFLLFFLLCILLITPVLASTGDPNMGGGSGDMGDGSGSSYWNPGWDGVRLTVVDTSGNQVRTPIDLTNKTISGDTFHFGKHSKLYYRNTPALTPNTSNYNYFNPVTDLPTIINWTGGNNIEAIKRYFTDTGNLHDIAGYLGIAYDDLVSGDYKLLIEPIAYFKYNDLSFAMTATEAALYDITTSHDLYYDMRTLTHQNLPLAMYLEKTDSGLGLGKWTGTTTGFQANIDIIKYLGAGVVSFEGEPEEIIVDPSAEYIYHTDTDVITAISFTNTWGEISPEDPAYVVFTINGTTYSKEFICPDGGHQMVWVRWHTPDTPQTITVTATCSKIGLSTSVTCQVVELEEVTPPNPIYTTTGSITVPTTVPDFGSNTTTTWGEWFAEWVENWVWVSDWYYDEDTAEWTDYGDWEDQGWYDWEYVTYTAKLKVDYELTPDSRVKTAFYSATDGYEMKSGYGVNAVCKVVITRSDGASSYDVTDVQNVVSVFPEFQYETYNRLLEFTQTLHGYDYWEFKENRYSYYEHRVHFTPLRYPDETDYTVPLNVMDVWTPGGQLTATVSDSILINGTAIDDGYIRILD